MRSYRIDTNRLINELVPHYLGGRRLVLYLQALMEPLNTLNRRWKVLADDMRLEASTTSQVILIEHVLNRKFGKYLKDKARRIVISDGDGAGGVPLYSQESDGSDDTLVLYGDDEAQDATHASKPFRFNGEKMPDGDISFTVSCPAFDSAKITEQELTAMITNHVNKFKLAGETFNVKYN